MKLYGKLAKQFSNSRAFPWKGWEKVLELIKTNYKSPLSVLDLGCGNGRFLDFLQSENIQIAKYVGIDNSSELLDIAKKRYSGNNSYSTEFIFADLEAEWLDQVSEKFDLICIFGVMHHLKDNQSRVSLLRNSKEILNDNGLIISTYWQFGNYDRFTSKGKFLGKNNYLLPFGDEAEARFCHFTDQAEAQFIENQANVNLSESFYSDGGDSKLNLYRVYK